MAELITEPGEYAMTKAEYEADPVQGGSLRASIARLLASKTPRHAWHESPRLNPFYKRQEKRHWDIGTAAHEILLGKGAGFSVIDAADYRSKGAQDARQVAYAKGLTPLLKNEHTEIQDMVSAIRAQLRDLVDFGTLQDQPFRHNETERVIVWREDNGVWCRASMDGFDLSGNVLSEFKTEGQSADPQTWHWRARKLGYIFTAAFYCRGLSKLGLAHSPSVQFFVAEKEPPYLLSLCRVDDELLMKENERVIAAIRLWGRCMAQDRWPGYSLEGYDIGLTDRERIQEAQAGIAQHLASEDIAASL